MDGEKAIIEPDTGPKQSDGKTKHHEKFKEDINNFRLVGEQIKTRPYDTGMSGG